MSAKNKPIFISLFLCLLLTGFGDSSQALSADQRGLLLMTAIAEGDEKTAERYIADGANLSLVDSAGRTSLHLAVETKQPDIVRLLLENDADPNTQDHEGRTPLRVIIDNKEIRSPSSLRGLFGIPKFKLYEIPDDIIIRLLLENDADPNIPDYTEKRTAFHEIVDWWDFADMIQLFLESGADPNIPDHYGEIALHLAIDGVSYFMSEEDQINDVIRPLLENGADPNILDHKGRTPLYKAIDESQKNIARLLLENDANPNIRTREENHKFVLRWTEGWTSVHLAVYKAAIRDDHTLIMPVLESGGDLNIQAYYGDTALHIAAECGGALVVTILLENGADIHITNERGEKAIDVATKRLGETSAKLAKELNWEYPDWEDVADLRAKKEAYERIVHQLSNWESALSSGFDILNLLKTMFS